MKPCFVVRSCFSLMSKPMASEVFPADSAAFAADFHTCENLYNMEVAVNKFFSQNVSHRDTKHFNMWLRGLHTLVQADSIQGTPP